MDEQRRVTTFIETHALETDPAYHLLDLVAEVGEVAAEVNESTRYGEKPDAVDVPEDELGDALFSLLAVCNSLEVDASAALETSLEKYERRLEERGTPGSGSVKEES